MGDGVPAQANPLGHKVKSGDLLRNKIQISNLELMSRRANRRLYYNRWRGIPRHPQTLMPDFLCLRHRYLAPLQISSAPDFLTTFQQTAATVGMIQYNGLYDPVVATGGQQPSMYDIAAQLYNTYIVTDVWATIWLGNDVSNNSQQLVVGWNVPVRDASAYISLKLIMQEPELFHAKWVVQNGGQIGSGNRSKLKLEWHLAETDPQTPISEHLMMKDVYTAEVGYNPIFGPRMALISCLMSNGAADQAPMAWVLLSYRAVWAWPKTNVDQ